MCLVSFLINKVKACASFALGIEIAFLVVTNDEHKIALDPT
jgi:hypothetical protein